MLRCDPVADATVINNCRSPCLLLSGVSPEGRCEMVWGGKNKKKTILDHKHSLRSSVLRLVCAGGADSLQRPGLGDLGRAGRTTERIGMETKMRRISPTDSILPVLGQTEWAGLSTTYELEIGSSKPEESKTMPLDKTVTQRHSPRTPRQRLSRCIRYRHSYDDVYVLLCKQRPTIATHPIQDQAGFNRVNKALCENDRVG
jgi:hypothetical protein